MLVGGLIWAYIIGAMSSVLLAFDQHNMHYKQVMDDLNYMMVEQGIGKDMQRKLRTCVVLSARCGAPHHATLTPPLAHSGTGSGSRRSSASTRTRAS